MARFSKISWCLLAWVLVAMSPVLAQGAAAEREGTIRGAVARDDGTALGGVTVIVNETGSIATLYAIDGDGGDQILAVGDIGTVLRWTFIPD